MDLDLSSLQAFVALADQLHFRKASERLFLSQPALSKKIQRLEEKLGGGLFVRSRRSVALTDATTCPVLACLIVIAKKSRPRPGSPASIARASNE